jgi:hypothetical protein
MLPRVGNNQTAERNGQMGTEPMAHYHYPHNAHRHEGDGLRPAWACVLVVSTSVCPGSFFLNKANTEGHTPAINNQTS